MIAFLFTSLALIEQTPAVELLAALAEANLATASTLVKPDSLAERVRLVPQRLQQAVALVGANGKFRSTKAKETSLFNAYEKIALAGKGVFTKQNHLGANAFEFVAGDGAKQGKLIFYADSSFSKPLFFIRWNAKKSATDYLFRTVENNALKSEALSLNRDGSGSYSLTIEKTLRRTFYWDSDGNPAIDETF